jgi:hypothetical protein
LEFFGAKLNTFCKASSDASDPSKATRTLLILKNFGLDKKNSIYLEYSKNKKNLSQRIKKIAKKLKKIFLFFIICS